MVTKCCAKLDIAQRCHIFFFLSMLSVKIQGHIGQKIADFDPNWAFLDLCSSLNSQWFWNDAQILKCPFVFQGHPSNFKVTQDRESPILTRFEHFRIVILVLIHRWLWNDAPNLTYIKEVPHCFQGHPTNFEVKWNNKIADFDPNWEFPDCNSRLNSPMALKRCTKLDVVQKRCPIVLSKASVKFQGHTG